MTSPGDVCPSCRSARFEQTLESTYPQRPYRLCNACATRLTAPTLRPREWYNLAVIFGPHEHYLHDDFYDESGQALQPEGEVTDAAAHPAPTLEEVRGDPEALLDYAMTRYSVDPPLLDALRAHAGEALLASLDRRVRLRENETAEEVAYAVVGPVLGRAAEPCVRRRWDEAGREYLYRLAEASAQCLPPDDGFERVERALEQYQGKDLSDRLLAMAPFRSPRAPDWIERRVADPITGRWGDLAAVSGIDWPRVEAWLDRGRPLSLVALDALAACDSPRQSQSMLLRQAAPKLLNPPPRDVAVTRLRQYAEGDKSPRVSSSVQYVIEKWGRICGAGAE
jgi:hypothetical protein